MDIALVATVIKSFKCAIVSTAAARRAAGGRKRACRKCLREQRRPPMTLLCRVVHSQHVDKSQ